MSLREMRKIHRWGNSHNILDRFLFTYDCTLILDDKKSVHLSFNLPHTLSSTFPLTRNFFQWLNLSLLSTLKMSHPVSWWTSCWLAWSTITICVNEQLWMKSQFNCCQPWFWEVVTEKVR